LVLDNLRQAFPEWTSARCAQVAARVWKNVGRVAAEFVRLDDVTPSNYKDYVFYDGYEHVEHAAALGRGIIFVTFHFTNWEMTGVGAQFELKRLIAIARPIKNPLVEAWVQRKRAASGMRIILHRQAVKESLRALRRGDYIGILSDQNLYTGGVFVDFFGRPAASTTLPALLYARTDAPVIISYTLRENGRFKIVFEPPVKFPSVAAGSDPIEANTAFLAKELERIVRQKPENWFWVHNRWKRKPEAKIS
jgi:KDO2-lipid IV(A) lauroyltransferase